MGQALQGGAIGIAGTVLVMLVCLAEFVRSRWPGLLFWFGAALGACVAQGLALWAGVGGDGTYSVATNGAIGAVIGMLVGGAAADVWQERHRPPPDDST